MQKQQVSQIAKCGALSFRVQSLIFLLLILTMTLLDTCDPLPLATKHVLPFSLYAAQ